MIWAIITITSPVFGVILGGYLMDKSDQRDNLHYCYSVSFRFIFLSYVFLNLFAVANHPLASATLLWLGICSGNIFKLGAAVVPINTTLLIESLPV